MHTFIYIVRDLLYHLIIAAVYLSIRIESIKSTYQLMKIIKLFHTSLYATMTKSLLKNILNLDWYCKIEPFSSYDSAI